MNSVPGANGEIAVHKREDQRRWKQIQEAQKIYEWLLFRRRLAGDLISASVKLIEDKEEVATASLDLSMIARHLAKPAAADSWDAICKPYQRHFIGDENRQLFFRKLQRVMRQIASILLVRGSQTERERSENVEAHLLWDESLLPKSIAPWVVRLATLHPGVLEYFLPRFFIQISDCLIRRSTYRRALVVLQGVQDFGWSAEKHTRRLIEIGELQLAASASEVETVKKFIRDLRRRYKKQLSLMQQPGPVQGTSSAPKATA